MCWMQHIQYEWNESEINIWCIFPSIEWTKFTSTCNEYRIGNKETQRRIYRSTAKRSSERVQKFISTTAAISMQDSSICDRFPQFLQFSSRFPRSDKLWTRNFCRIIKLIIWETKTDKKTLLHFRNGECTLRHALLIALPLMPKILLQ